MDKSLRKGEKGEKPDKSILNIEKNRNTEKDSSFGTVKKLDKIENEEHYFEKVQRFETSGKMEKSMKKSARFESSVKMENSIKKSTRNKSNKRIKNSEKVFENASFASKSPLKLAKPDLTQKEFGYLLKFLYRGYRHEYYYWEIVLYTKKFLLIFIGSFSEFFPNSTKATILLIILTYYLFLQARQKPYETYFLNNIEYLSLIVTFLTANTGIMLFTPDLHQYSQIFLMMIIFINFSYIGLWCYYFYTYVIKISKLSPRLERYLNCCLVINRTLKGLVFSIIGIILNKRLALKIKNYCKRLFSWKCIVFKGILGDILGKKKTNSKVSLTKESSES